MGYDVTRAKTAAAPEFYEATTSIASEWIDQNLGDFPGGVVRQGTIVRAGHPILEAHGNFFEPLRSDVGEGTPPRRRQAL
jgi:hypothetical protein